MAHQVETDFLSYLKQNIIALLKLGCGKTQLSMQLCSQSFFNNKYRNNHISIAYIDTENNLSARRFRIYSYYNLVLKDILCSD